MNEVRGAQQHRITGLGLWYASNEGMWFRKRGLPGTFHSCPALDCTNRPGIPTSSNKIFCTMKDTRDRVVMRMRAGRRIQTEHYESPSNLQNRPKNSQSMRLKLRRMLRAIRWIESHLASSQTPFPLSERNQELLQQAIFSPWCQPTRHLLHESSRRILHIQIWRGNMLQETNDSFSVRGPWWTLTQP